MGNNLPESGTLIFRPASIVHPLAFSELYAVNQPLEVELGAGDGSFLISHAQAHPERNFLGVERLLGRLRKIDKKARRLRLENVRLIRMEANYVAQYLLPPQSVTAFHIYFPDPWPKRRHWKNRLITAPFTRVLLKALVPGGIVYLRTDNREYYEQMLHSFRLNDTFVKIETPEELLAFTTDFERGFNAQGIQTLRAAYRC